MNAEAARTDRELQMVERLVDCAHDLALRFGEAAMDEPDARRALDFHTAFDRGFLAVRMGIRLSLTLRKPIAVAANDTEVEADTRERREPRDAERERDREYEPVSLPKFLATLRKLATDAAQLPAPPTILPSLQELLTSYPSSSWPGLSGPPINTGERDRAGRRHRVGSAVREIMGRPDKPGDDDPGWVT